ncbi:hypothetical protein ACLKA6_019455 [Drosophila palustris]
MVCKWVRCGRDVGADMGFCGCKRYVLNAFQSLEDYTCLLTSHPSQMKASQAKAKAIDGHPTPHESGYVLTVPDLVGGLTLPQSPQQQQ